MQDANYQEFSARIRVGPVGFDKTKFKLAVALKGLNKKTYGLQGGKNHFFYHKPSLTSTIRKKYLMGGCAQKILGQCLKSEYF
jgi:hypothetical protein